MIWFGLVIYLVGSYILNIYDLVWLGYNHCRLFKAKSTLYTYILNMYDLVWFSYIFGWVIYIKYI